MDFKDSFNSYMNKKQSANGNNEQPPVKMPAAPRAPMEYERRSLIILRRPLWF